MNWQAITFDWNQARAFLVTAEEGSLSAAARALKLTQPTLGRQVSALEERLGVTLFERAGRVLALTQAGIDLLEHFRAMGEAANRISLAASGQSQAIEGTVAITATDVMAAHFLPPILQRIRAEAPGIVLEVVASNDIRDLTRREADIAIRHARPEQPDLIARLVGETTGHLYAAKDYLDRFGRPQTPADLATVDFIGFGHAELMLPTLNRLGLPLTRENSRLVTASGTALVAMVQQGLGVSVLGRDIAERTPGLEQVLPEIEPIPIPVWLVTHRELHTSRRIRLVFDVLAEELGQLADGLAR